jgi:hypothetical protein
LCSIVNYDNCLILWKGHNAQVGIRRIDAGLGLIGAVLGKYQINSTFYAVRRLFVGRKWSTSRADAEGALRLDIKNYSTT